MGVIHRKRIAVDRPDGVDVTLVRGHAAWNATHRSPDFMAYMLRMPSAVSMHVGPKNSPDTELPGSRSKYDFTYVDQLRIVVGNDYGNMKVALKYSSDKVTWRHFSNASTTSGGPFVTLPGVNATPTIQASAWTAIHADAKRDLWIAVFLRDNPTANTLQRISTVFVYVR